MVPVVYRTVGWYAAPQLQECSAQLGRDLVAPL